MKNRMQDIIDEWLPLIVIGGFFVVMLAIMVVGSYVSAKSKVRMIEQTTGKRYDVWDVFWGGDPPTSDVQVRVKDGDK